MSKIQYMFIFILQKYCVAALHGRRICELLSTAKYHTFSDGCQIELWATNSKLNLSYYTCVSVCVCWVGNKHSYRLYSWLSIMNWSACFFMSVTFFLAWWGLLYPVAIQATDSSVMAAVWAINTVCLVSFLAVCIKHWITAAGYSRDLFPYTCWVGEM